MILTRSIPPDIKEKITTSIETVAHHRYTRVALFALSWTAGFAATATYALSPALIIVNVIMISTVGLGVWIVGSRIIQGEKSQQLQKIVNLGMVTLGITSGVVAGNLIAAGFITTVAGCLALQNLSASLAISSALIGSATLGYGFSAAKLLYSYTFKAIRGVWNSTEQLEQMREHGCAGLASIREIRQWATVFHDRIPEILHNDFWKCAVISMDDSELESFLLSHRNMKITIGSIGSERLEKFYVDCEKRAEKIISSYTSLSLIIPEDAEEVDRLIKQINDDSRETQRLIALFHYYPNGTYTEIRKRLKICYNKWLINDVNNELRGVLRKSRNHIHQEEDPEDPACVVLGHIFTLNDCREYVDELQLALVKQNPILTVQSELEKGGLGTRKDLQKRGFLPFRGTTQEQKTQLMDLLRIEPYIEEERTTLITKIIGVLDRHRPEHVALLKKISRTVKTMLFEVSIWTARWVALVSQPISFCVGLAYVLTHPTPLYYIDSFIPNSDSFANCSGFFDHLQQYAQGVGVNSIGFASGYLTGRGLIRWGRRTMRSTQIRRMPALAV